MKTVNVGIGAPMSAIYGLQATFDEALAGQPVQVGLPAVTRILREAGRRPQILRNKRIPHFTPNLEIWL